MAKKIPLTHPGKILLEDYLKPMGISQYQLAKAMGVPQIRISEIVRRKRSISPATALKLSRCLGMSDQFWIGLQAEYDMRLARRESEKDLDKIERLRAAL